MEERRFILKWCSIECVFDRFVVAMLKFDIGEDHVVIQVNMVSCFSHPI